MTDGLETFAKVRTLHDRAHHPGEKAAAAGRMEALGSAAGMTVAEAASKLDASTPKPSSLFEDLFNSPEARAADAERARRDADRRAEVLAEVGTEDAVWKAT